jgi:hypothetical protein
MTLDVPGLPVATGRGALRLGAVALDVGWKVSSTGGKMLLLNDWIQVIGNAGSQW